MPEFNSMKNGINNMIQESQKEPIISENQRKQFDIIQKENPAMDNYHTWVRKPEDIKDYKTALSDPDYEGDDLYPDFKRADIDKALKTGKMRVYSSYPIEQGIRVTPSKMEDEGYGGNYYRDIDLDEVAWVDPTQGMFASLKETQYPRKAWTQFKEHNILDLYGKLQQKNPKALKFKDYDSLMEWAKKDYNTALNTLTDLLK